jgi:hypothetical protein
MLRRGPGKWRSFPSVRIFSMGTTDDRADFPIIRQ